MSDALWKKAVFVYPKLFADTYWSFNRTLKKYISSSEFGTPKASLPPIGLQGLANHQRNLYEEILVTDRNIDSRPLKDLIKDADHVYIGSMIAQKEGTLRDAKITKDLGKILIVGGTFVDKDSEIANLADYAVENEAEMVMDELNYDLKNENLNKYYKGTPTTPDKFFIPDFSLINPDNYINVALQFSRGCPEACEFCDITSRFGRKPRYTPLKHIEQSLNQLYDLGSRQALFVVDDNFIGNPAQTIKTLKKVNEIEKKLGYNRPKFTELTLRLADKTERMDNLRKWLHKTNFFSFFTGVETPNIASLKETGKSYNFKGSETIEEKMYSISKNTGAAIMTGMIHGFDNDTRESADKMIEFINGTHSVLVMTGLLMALPHTELEKRLKKEGRLIENATGDNSDGRINFIPYNFSAKEAEEDIVKIQESIYSPKAYFTRVMKELEVLEPQTSSTTRSSWESAKALIKIMTKDNAHIYWKNVFKALKIANNRFKFGTSENFYIINEYFTHAARYTQFRGQTKMLRKLLNKRIKNNEYEPWQLYSWKSMQESPIKEVQTLEKQQEEPSLYDRIAVELKNQYEFVGTRIEAMSHFVEPYLKERLNEIKNIKFPTKEQLMNIEIKSYLDVHINRPQILDKINFSNVENYLNDKITNQMDYLTDMTLLFRTISQRIAT